MPENGNTPDDRVETFRSRARSLASLTAAAAGALAVGLVLLPDNASLTPATKALSVLGLTALIASTVCFGFASAARASSKSGLARVAQAMTLRQVSEVPINLTDAQFEASRDKLKREIFYLTDLGGLLAVGACLSILAGVLLSQVLPTERLHVRVNLVSNKAVSAVCAAVPEFAEGTISANDLSAPQGPIAVRLSKLSCSAEELVGFTLLAEPNDILLLPNTAVR